MVSKGCEKLNYSIMVLAGSAELNSGLQMGLQWDLSMEHLHLGALRAQLVKMVLNFHLSFHFFAVDFSPFSV